ncbi:sugar ABC transporter substrate-binding protein [Microbacterium sp. MAHUQ-60]|uniref:sugar ABC transporter substrate-binding protein n=1 Tax=unclassified Microbacterium TaxID=2609290 RepID=UPI003611879B
MWKNRVVLAAAALCAATIALSGCSVPDSSEAGTGDSSPSTSTLLGIVTISATDANNARVIQGATKAAEEAGWTVEVVDAAGNADQANTAIQNFVNKDAGMIFNLVFPATSLGAGLNAASQAKVPVATWGGGPGTGIAVVAGDGAPFAEPATQAMIDALAGQGDVLALTYRTGQVCRDREALFDEMMAAQAPEVSVTKNEVNIPGFLQDGARYANAWLAAHPAGSGNLAIWGCWEDPTLGAISSLKQQGRTDVLTYGINGSSTAIQAVKDGTLTATVFEDAFAEGQKMFEETVAAIESGDFTSRTVDVPGILVSSDNIEAFLAEHPEALD